MAKAQRKTGIKTRIEFFVPCNPADLASVQAATAKVDAFKRSITEQGYTLTDCKAEMANVIIGEKAE